MRNSTHDDVIPAKAGIHLRTKEQMDARFRGHDVVFDMTTFLA